MTNAVATHVNVLPQLVATRHIAVNEPSPSRGLSVASTAGVSGVPDNVRRLNAMVLPVRMLETEPQVIAAA